MLDKNKQCKNCGFDTMAIVTIETSNWEYCPVCGSRLVSVKDDIEGNVDEEDITMREIPIGDSDNEEVEDFNGQDQSRKIEVNSDDPTDEENQEDDRVESDNSESTGGDVDLDELMDDPDFVEDELERLRKFVDNENSDK